MIRLLIADNDVLIREGLRKIIESDPGLTVVGQAGNGQEAVALCRSLMPDVVLMDIEMPVLDGMEATRLIKQSNSRTKVLILTVFNQTGLIQKAVEYRCDGFLMKGLEMEPILATIKNTHKGLKTWDPGVFEALCTNRMFEVAISQGHSSLSTAGLEKLNKRELDLVKQVTSGMKDLEIAELLHVTEGHIRNTLKGIRDKLGLRNSKELAAWGAKNGL